MRLDWRLQDVGNTSHFIEISSDASSLVYNPHLRQQSDEALLKQAKLQALGLPAPDPSQRRHRGDRQEMATDEAVSFLGFLPSYSKTLLFYAFRSWNDLGSG